MYGSVVRVATESFLFVAEAWPPGRWEPAVSEVDRDAASRLSGLTLRQRDVLARTARGHSGRRIARDLRLTEKGVDSHKYRIMNRLGVRDRVGLARLAIRAGLAAP